MKITNHAPFAFSLIYLNLSLSVTVLGSFSVDGLFPGFGGYGGFLFLFLKKQTIPIMIDIATNPPITPRTTAKTGKGQQIFSLPGSVT